MRHTVQTMPAANILNKISNLELDIGLSYLQDERLKDFATIPMFVERYVLIARDDSIFAGRNTLSWSEIAHLPLCLLTNNMQCRHSINAAFAAAGKTVLPQVETDSMMALYSFVRCASLYSIVPHNVLMLLEMRQELSAIPLAPQLQRKIGLVMQKRIPLAPLLSTALKNFRSLDLQARVDALINC